MSENFLKMPHKLVMLEDQKFLDHKWIRFRSKWIKSLGRKLKKESESKGASTQFHPTKQSKTFFSWPARKLCSVKAWRHYFRSLVESVMVPKAELGSCYLNVIDNGMREILWEFEARFLLRLITISPRKASIRRKFPHLQWSQAGLTQTKKQWDSIPSNESDRTPLHANAVSHCAESAGDFVIIGIKYIYHIASSLIRVET